MDALRVFISYTHESETHKEWVRKLATDLRQNGVDVTLDQWELRKGADLTRFMEVGIRESSRVLLVFTPAYCEKSNRRTGGVGYESLVITGELAANLDTTKFVGVLRAGSWDTAVPSFMASRLNVDFRQDDLYAAALDELLRDLHGVPVYPKPPLGTNPFAATGPEGAVSRPAKVTEIPATPDTDERPKHGDASEFIRDVTIPDGSYIKVGQDFEKIWEIQNVGTVVWRNRFLKREGACQGVGLIMSPDKVPIPETHPGQVARICVPMKAPNIPTTTTCIWKMVNEHGRRCFPDKYPYGLAVTINVIE